MRTRGVVRTRSCIVRSIGPPAAPAARSSPPPSSSGSRSSPARASKGPVPGTGSRRRPTRGPSAARACSARRLHRADAGRARRRDAGRPGCAAVRRCRPAPRDGSPFGASRHARPGGGRPRPRGPAPSVASPDPVGPAGAPAAGRRRAVGDRARRRRGRHGGGRARAHGRRDHRVAAPVESAAPAPAGPLGPVLAAPAPSPLPDQPTVQIKDLVSGVTAQMRKARPPHGRGDAVHDRRQQDRALSSPAAMRKAAMTNALAKLGKPYRWGARARTRSTARGW